MSIRNQKIIAVVVLIIALCVLFWFALKKNTASVDWYYTYYPATRALNERKSPYVEAPLFFAPVWSLIPPIPFALLPYDIGRALYFVCSLVGFAFLGYKAGCKPVGIACFLLSAPVANCIQTGNIEWLALLGAFMPAPIGMVFLSMKPQSTIGIIIFLLIIASKRSLREVLYVLLPTTLLFLTSFLIYGLWFLRFQSAFLAADDFVIRIWPFGIPAGLVCLFLAVRRQKIDFAFAASPLLSPYTILITWSGFILSFARSTKAIALVSGISWVLWYAFITLIK